MNITIKDIDDLKSHVGDAVSKDVQSALSPLVEKLKQATDAFEGLRASVDKNCTDIKNLKANQGKALVGWTVLVLGTTALLTQAKTWLVSHLHLT